MGRWDRLVQRFRNLTTPESSHTEYAPTLKSGDSYKDSIVIDKSRQHLYRYDSSGKLVFHTPVSTGLNAGNKKKEDDLRTPVGKFAISQFEPDSDPSIYGDPRFWRLRGTGFKGIGIHGDAGHPEDIGLPASHGCIRMPVDSLNSFQRNGKPFNGQTVYILDESGNYKLGGNIIYFK